MKKNKILYVSTVDMYSNTGGGLVTRAFYNAYLKLFPERIVLMHAEEYYKGSEKNTYVILTKRRSRFFKIINFIKGHVHRFYPEIVNFLKNHRDEYSECVINGGVYAGDSIEKIKELGIKVTVIHHNFERQYHLDNKTIASFYGKSACLVNHWEKKAYLIADNNLFLTQYDLEKFKKTYGKCKGKSYCIGTFMPSNIEMPRKDERLGKTDISLVISGALDFPQSYNSIIKFSTNIFSKIENLNIKLIITGRNPSKEIEKLTEKPNIELIASPSDINDVIIQGDIYICPIDCGGGIKMRIMDGLKCGMPIITHYNSVRGYESFLDKDYFGTYSTYEDFFDVLNFMIDKIKLKKFSSRDIQLDYKNYFSIESGINRLKKFYNIK